MTSTQEDTAETATSNAERLREEVTHYVGLRLERAVGGVGGKLTDLTGRLTDIAESGGKLPAALLSGKAKSVKDSVVDKAKGLTGGGGSESRPGSGDVKVTNIVEVLDVGVPLRSAYDHWTEYDKFAAFTKGVGNVSEDDDTTTTWTAKVGPSTRSFEATVLEQIPDDRIVWTSEGSKGSTQGAVSFHELAPNLTRIVLVVEYYPSGFFEKTGNIWRAQGRRLRLDFKNFQRYVTLTDAEPEAWRGEIRDGEVVRTHEDAVAAEDDTDEAADDTDEAAEDTDEAAEDKDEDTDADEERTG